MTQHHAATLLRFLFVGVANTLFGLLVIYACKWLLHFGDAAANLTGYLCGLMLSFLLNRSWTFRHRGAVLPALGLFLLVFAIAYVANLVCVLALICHYGVNAWLAQALGILPYTIVFYLGSRYLAFRPTGARLG